MRTTTVIRNVRPSDLFFGGDPAVGPYVVVQRWTWGEFRAVEQCYYPADMVAELLAAARKTGERIIDRR